MWIIKLFIGILSVAWPLLTLAETQPPRAELQGSRIARVNGARLSNSRSKSAGYLEVQVEGKWSFACGDKFVLADAKVTCKQLGYEDGKLVRRADILPQTASLLEIDPKCTGQEADLSHCPTVVSDTCSNRNMIAVICSNLNVVQDVRFANATKTATYGIIEYLIEGSWTLACDDTYSQLLAAKVACKQLGFNSGIFQPDSALGSRSDQSKLSVSFECKGDESRLSQCPTTLNEQCVSKNYLTLVCSRTVHVEKVKLTNSVSDNYGIFEVYAEDTWMAVCDFDYSVNLAKVVTAAKVACKQLGFHDGEFQPGSALGLKPDLKKVIVDMNCQGDERNLGECQTTISDFCLSNNYTTLTCIQSVNVTDVRLTNNDGILNYGILKFKIGDRWTAVCDNNFDLKVAKLACKHLGFVDGNYQPGSAIGKLAQVDITSVDMDCSGNQQLLSQCKTTVSDYCLNENYITLYCSEEPIIPKEQIEVRIPSRQNFGLVEANLFGFWGPICDKGWTDQAANTLCLQLNYKGGYAYYATTDSKEPMVLGGFNCSEYDKNLNECSRKEFGMILGCQYPQSITRRAAGVFCYGDNDGIQFKLSDRWYGRVQVNYDKKWGRVCNRNWGHKEASIMCKQLGYEDGVPDYTDSSPGSGEVRINNVNCTGSETSILECSHQPGWVQALGDCPGDAQVICKRKICGSIDIRNSVENLKRLEHCTVIEGNLTILLIDSNSWEDYQQYSFPNLVEITEFLVLFRVSKLKSLNTLFPNLAIIRGDKLFSDYALVAFEMPDLLELGLSSLVSIPRGAVRLEKNPNLCYIETVDWSRITTSVADSENYFKDNKDVQECVNRCPTDCGKTPDNISMLRRTVDSDQAVLRCWTIAHCQTMLDKPSNCHKFYTLDDKKTCCDPNCIAGCTGPSPQQCTACKDVMQYTGHRNLPTCTQQCTPATYMYKRRCLLAKECRNFTDYRLGMTIDLKLTESEDLNLKPGLCMTDCPSGYNVDPVDKQKCVKCKGRCPKICTGKVIDSVHAAQELKDCNIIKGPLSIKLMQGGQIAEELEANLADIEEITEFIMISHSEALMSLHFFKNLRRIGGERLHQDKYVFYAYDNLNLQELFPEGLAKNLTLGNGSVLFQYNRKLCYNKISQFITDVGRNISLITSEEISNENNGDQMPCQMQTLTLTNLKVSPHIAFVKWTRMNISDSRLLIGYSINWKVSPEMNASIYKGVDACTDDLWESKDVCTDDKCETAFGFIAGLEPWTQYAAYIRALTVSKAVQGAISDIMYFRTGPEVPTSPINLQVIAKVPGQLVVTWDPPKRPNGNVTHYQVYWQRRDFIKDEYEMRNYCTNPLLLSTPERDKELKEEEDKKKKNGTISGECCACPQTDKEKKVEDRERNLDIQFQDFLQNQIYVKRVETAATTLAPSLRARSRRARSVPADPHEVNKYTYKSQIGDGNPTLILSTVTPDGNHTDLNMTDANGTAITTTPSSEDKNSKPEKKKDNPFYMADVYVERKFIIANLGHFEDYNIEVIACHTRPSDSKEDMLCSNQALGFGRTLPEIQADKINSSLVEVKHLANKTGAVHITWRDPTNPNGVILTYDIEYMNTNIRNVKPILICITYAMYRDIGKGGHILDKLDPGNYTFKLRATSLAGNGSWTEPLSFNIQDHTSKELQRDTMIGIIVSVLVVIIFITVVLVWFIAKKRFGNKLPPGMLVSTNPDYMADYEAYVPDEWEVDRDNVELIKELGQGSFGMVYEGIVKNLAPGQDRIPVAVKTTNKQSTDHDRYQFLQEASIMKQFNCYHVVKLIGVVSRDQPAYVLMELMPNGDLKNFLRLHRPDEEDNDGRTPPTLKQILQIAGEIADGMAYLADKKYVHRDLAARNCMVGADMTVKIGDFGMTRDIYETDYYRKGSRGLLPVRWMAPESLKDGVFTSLTDVWSYGVVLWEMATLAAQPYQGLSNEEVLRYVGSGKIMDTPERCPTRLYDLMVKCWRYRPKQRPTFKEIIELLLPDLDKKFKEVSYFFSEENAKYEESKQTSASNNHEEPLEDVDEFDHPMNDYVDESHLPMLGAGASNGHSVELQDIFTDSGSYPHYSSSHNKQHVGSAEMCDCSFREQAGAAAQSLVEFNRQSVCSSPNSAIGGSSDGSKDSSKSSSSSYAHMNGLSVANGHVPVHMRTTPC